MRPRKSPGLRASNARWLLLLPAACRGAPPTPLDDGTAVVSSDGGRDAGAAGGDAGIDDGGTAREHASEASAGLLDASDAALIATAEASTVDACAAVPDTQRDPNNCGRCGHGCLGGGCDNGVCEAIALATTGVAHPSSVAVDSTNVYWTESADSSNDLTKGAVRRLPLTSAGNVPPTLVASSQVAPTDVVPTVSGILWINSGLPGATPGGGLQWLPPGATSPTTVANNTCPVTLTVTSTDVYWINCDPSSNNESQELLTVPLGHIDALPTPVVPSGIACADAMATRSGEVFWLQTGCFPKAGRVEALVPALAATPTALSPEPGLSGQYPLRIAVDSEGVYVGYNTTGLSGAGSIGRVPIDGGPPTLIVPIANANGIAVDDGHVYWTDFYESAVRAAPLDGGAAITLAAGQTTPLDITVDDEAVYWVDDSGDAGAVMKVAKP